MAETTELRQLVQLQRGQSYKGALLGEPGPFLLGLGTIQPNGGFRGENLKTYGGHSPGQTLLRARDLYVSLKDVTHSADLLGAVARVPNHVESGRLTQDTIRLDVDDTRVDRDYLYWLLRTPEFREHCRARGTGTTNLDLSREDFLSYKVALPSRVCQRATADLLEALDDKIAANSKLAATAEGLINARWLKLVHGLVDVAEWRSIGSCGKVVTGKTPPTSISENYGGETPFVTVGDMRNGLFVSSTERTLSKQGVAAVRGALLPAGAVLMSCIATVGEVAVTSVPSVTNQQINALIPDNELDPTFTSYSFRALGAELKGMGSGGSVYTNVSKSKFSSLRIPVPPYEAQVRVVSELDRVSSSARTEIALITATRDALLPQLMSGKLRVKDAERVLEDAGV